MQTYQIGTYESGQRLDKFLHKFMPAAPNGFLYKMLRKKNIVLNGKKAEGKEILGEGDIVSFYFSEDTFGQFTNRPAEQPMLAEYRDAYRSLKGIEVVYEDANVLILDKPAGILTQKADDRQPSLNEWMIGYLLETEKISEGILSTFKPSVSNRLDRNTSGLVLCGISLSGSQMLSGLMRERNMGKYYMAIVKGHVEKAGEITGFLEKDEKSNRVRIGCKKEAAKVRTAYMPLAAGRDFTLLEIKLITGKTHQIRAHMASIHHPILGDAKYGDREWNEKYRKKCHVKYQLLHACRIEFPRLEEPFTSVSKKTIVAKLPPVFGEVLKYGNVEFQGP